MKKIKIIQAAVAIVIVTTLASCAASYYPYGPSGSLIVSSAPGVYTYRYPDGRYYYRSPQGYLYWRGYDNRYYLDRSYIGKLHYNRREYNEWSRHSNNYNNRNGYHH
jgi:hypothetical protein